MAGTAGMLSIGTYGEYSDEEETEHHSSEDEDEVTKVEEDGENKNLTSANNATNNLDNNSGIHNNTTGDDDSSEERLGPESAVDNISDEENSRVDLTTQIPRMFSNRPVDREISKKTEDDKDQKLLKAKTRLVSYGDVEDKSESEKDDSDADPDPEKFLVISQDKDSVLKPEQASSLSRSVQNMLAEDIQIPPEPAGRCSRSLQEKIANYYINSKQEGHNLSQAIQQRKDFRNPSIYEKLIEFCQINEKGTNYPPEIFDPLVWGSESLYDSLDKMQKLDMEKREKERKERTKIEFVTGTKKAPSSTDGPVEKKRKTKWDAQPQGPAAVAAAAALVRQPGVTTAILNPARGALTTTATGTKSTVIPALGNIMKTK